MPYESAAAYFGDSAGELARAAASVDTSALAQAAEVLLDAYARE